MPFVDVADASLHYRRLGGGPPLLLLAGMASDGASWQPVLESLAARHTLIVPDNRGSGQTRDAGGELSREIMAADALAVLDDAGVERVAILGHSMGAMLGWTLALGEPARVSALIPMAALPVASRARVELFTTLARVRHRADEADWFRLLFQLLFRSALFEDTAAVDAAVDASLAYPHKQDVDAFARQAAALASFAAPLDPSGIRCPVHPLCAAEDVLSPPSDHTEFHTSLGSGTPVRVPRIVERAAHALHWDRPDAVVAHVARALEEPSGR